VDRLKLVIAYCIACIPINWIDGSIAVDLLRSLASMSLVGLFASVDCSTAIRRVSEVKRTRRRHQLPAGLPSEVEAPSCHSAGVIPGQTSFANVRPRAVDRTRRRDADISNKGRAAIPVAPHSSLFVVDECARDPLKRRVILQ
jgi:hypothetical protein